MEERPMQILVLLRECCDPRPPARLTADGFAVSDRGLRRLLNPADLSALEMALQMADKGRGAEVTAVAVGPARLDAHLRLALAMGARRAVRVWSSALEGGDAVAEAHLLVRLVTILNPQLILTGHRLLDRGDDPVPALAAARLGMTAVSAVLSAVYHDSELRIRRKSERGGRQVVVAATPGLLLCDAESCEPRYPAQAALQAALTAPVESWGLAELGLSPRELGAGAALLGKERLSFPRANPQRVVTPDANLPAFERILALLSGGIKPREGKLHSLDAEQTVARLLEIFRSEGLLPGSPP